MPTSLTAKPGFVSGALAFANGAPRRVRGLVLVVAGSLLATIMAPFGTDWIPFAGRFGFWLSVSLLNYALWEAWFAWWLRRGWVWWKVLLLGIPAMLLPLPLEVDLAARVFAGMRIESHLGVWLRGAAIAAVWTLAILLLAKSAPRAVAESRFPGTAIKLGEVAALTAEDHYVRLHLADGSERLLHARFTDAVAAMDGIPGAQLGRGAWLADRYRGPADYRGRRWFVRVGTGVWLPVSRGRVAALREMGWLARAG